MERRKRPLEEEQKPRKYAKGLEPGGLTHLPAEPQSTCGCEGRYHRGKSEKWGWNRQSQ